MIPNPFLGLQVLDNQSTWDYSPALKRILSLIWQFRGGAILSFMSGLVINQFQKKV